MRFRTATALAVAATLAMAVPAHAQTLNVKESAEYGAYLTDEDGRALYLFEADTQAQGDAPAKIACTGECLAQWPPLYTDAEPHAGDSVDAGKLGTVDHDGRKVVTYNGWPLYYFAEDQAAGDTKGQDVESFGAEWYLVTPEGEKAHD